MGNKEAALADRPIALEAYAQLADAYAAMVDTKAHNAYYERPAMLGLMPDVKGIRVLDAGCGSGRYAEWLVNNGADVVAFDVSPEMLDHARKRLGDRVRIELGDLNQPLMFLDDDSFDLVVCALVLDYVRDWRVVLGEFGRVLRPGGPLVFSMEHPLSEFTLRLMDDYFDVEYVEFTWRGFGKPVTVPHFRRPLMEVVNSLNDAGFQIERVVEPVPTPEFEEQDPGEYGKLMRRPGFLCMRARKTMP